jgi:hypothetical protein
MLAPDVAFDDVDDVDELAVCGSGVRLPPPPLHAVRKKVSPRADAITRVDLRKWASVNVGGSLKQP